MMFGRTILFKSAGLSVSDLRIIFRVEKSLIGYPNLANIKIYNLKESNRNLLEEESEDIELFAGYEDTPLLFSGDVINVRHYKQQVDWITELWCGDRTRILNGATINKTVSAGSTQLDLFNTLIDSVDGITKGITDGLAKCVSGKQSLLRGLQLTGNVKDWLKDIAEQ